MRRTSKGFTLLAVIGAAAVVFFGLLALGKAQEDCDAVGGTLVRGVVWYECVGDDR